MAKTTMLRPHVSLTHVSNTFALEGKELFNKVTHMLQTQFHAHATSLVDFDSITRRATLLATSCENHRHSTTSIPEFIQGSISQFSGQPILVCSKAYQHHPDDLDFAAHGIEALIAVPIVTNKGQTLGVVYSLFTHAIAEEDVAEILEVHQLFANLLTHGLNNKSLASRTETLVEQLSYEVSHDNLTGLFNRSYLSDKLEQLSDLTSQPFTLAYVDIDGFKSINDVYGNYIGDRVITFVAETIRRHVHSRELAFRIAGDEFAFITLSGDPFETCNKIIADLENGYQDSEHRIKLSASIGLARHTEQTITPDQIILNASLALKECKQTRHLNIQCYDTHLSAQYYRKALVIDALRAELDQADLAQSEIYVVTQPIVSREQSRWQYFEVLARWESSSLGNISPIEFVDAAEQSGLIVELGERIIELACLAKEELQRGLGYQVKFSINCSAHEILDANRYLHHLLNTIKRHNFTPYEFTIELTETALLSQTEEAKSILNKLRFLGFRVALDDFGTGYSSLSYIHSYPIDLIKIDASFIRDMLTNSTSENLVGLIIQLAQKLEVSLVAEGVEHRETLDKLHSMGCEQIQGYYYSRPEKPAAIIAKHTPTNMMKKRVSNG